jgi:hypothetical protein
VRSCSLKTLVLSILGAKWCPFEGVRSQVIILAKMKRKRQTRLAFSLEHCRYGDIRGGLDIPSFLYALSTSQSPILTRNPPLLDLGRIGDSGCLNDAVEVGVGVEEVNGVDEVEGVADVEGVSVEGNDEDEVLVMVFAGGFRDVRFYCRVVLLLSRHLVLILRLDLSNSCDTIVQILRASSIIRPSNTDAITNIHLLPPISCSSRFVHQLHHLTNFTLRWRRVRLSCQSSSLRARVWYRWVVFGDG